MVKITYTETAGKFMGNLKVEEDDGTINDIYIPKVLFDVIKSTMQNMTKTERDTLMARTLSVSKEL